MTRRPCRYCVEIWVLLGKHYTQHLRLETVALWLEAFTSKVEAIAQIMLCLFHSYSSGRAHVRHLPVCRVNGCPTQQGLGPWTPLFPEKESQTAPSRLSRQEKRTNVNEAAKLCEVDG